MPANWTPSPIIKPHLGNGFDTKAAAFVGRVAGSPVEAALPDRALVAEGAIVGAVPERVSVTEGVFRFVAVAGAVLPAELFRHTCQKLPN